MIIHQRQRSTCDQQDQTTNGRGGRARAREPGGGCGGGLADVTWTSSSRDTGKSKQEQNGCDWRRGRGNGQHLQGPSFPVGGRESDRKYQQPHRKPRGRGREPGGSSEEVRPQR